MVKTLRLHQIVFWFEVDEPKAFEPENMPGILWVGQRLEDYFASILHPEKTDKEPTPRQVAEYHILKEYFDVYQDESIIINE